MINIKNKNLFEIPFHEGLFIDKNYTIYVVNMETEEILETYPNPTPKFYFKGISIYPLELINLTFYGVRNRLDFIDYIKLNNEEIKINDIIFKKIHGYVDGYYISKFGAVYSTHRNCLRKREIDEDGYVRISFPHKGMTHLAIHRLVYSTWIREIPNGYHIDHKDNRKYNNHISNLQLMTLQENVRKAVNDFRFKSTINWDENKIIAVCEMMQNNLSVKDIADKMGIKVEDKKLYKNFRNQLYNLRNGNRSWKDITSKYDFSKYNGNIIPDSTYRDDEVSYMRELFAAGYEPKEIANIMNLEYSRYLVKIIRNEKRKNVKCIYNM